jgi:CRISPR/Cas system endoribonuclease Cas6 (RAMP superfamily)
VGSHQASVAVLQKWKDGVVKYSHPLKSSMEVEKSVLRKVATLSLLCFRRTDRASPSGEEGSGRGFLGTAFLDTGWARARISMTRDDVFATS